MSNENVHPALKGLDRFLRKGAETLRDLVEGVKVPEGVPFEDETPKKTKKAKPRNRVIRSKDMLAECVLHLVEKSGTEGPYEFERGSESEIIISPESEEGFLGSDSISFQSDSVRVVIHDCRRLDTSLVWDLIEMYEEGQE